MSIKQAVFFTIITFLLFITFLLYLKYKKTVKHLKVAKESFEESKKVSEIKVQAKTRQLREQARALREENERKTRTLKERLKELERFQKVTVGREMKMIELKEEIRKMEAQLRETNLALKKYDKKSKKIK